MKKLCILALSVLLGITLATIRPVNAAKTVDVTPELTNIAENKNVSFTSMDGQTVLYQRPFVSASDPLSDNLLTKTVGDYLYLRFNNAVFLSTTTTAKSTDNVSQLGWAVVDLGETYIMEGIGLQLWNDWTFSDVVVQVSDEITFANPVTVYSNDANDSLGFGRGTADVYTDVYTKLQEFSFSPVSGRYVRVTSNAKGTGYSLFSRIEVYGQGVIANPAISAEVAPVVANYASGTYYEYLTLELTSLQAGASIYYTLDGTYPTAASIRYTGALDMALLEKKVHLRAIAVVNGIAGPVSEFDYVVSNPDFGKNVASGKAASFMNAEFTAPIAFAGFNGSANNTLLLTDEGFDPGASCLNTVGGMGWAVIDLGKEYTIGSIVYSAWHDWWFAGTTIQIAKQADFSDAVTVFTSAAGIQNTANTGATYLLSEPTAARYVRATNNAKGEGTMSIFTEMKVIVGEEGTVSVGSNVAFQAENISAVGLDGTILSVQKQSSNSANTGTIAAIVDTDLSSWGAVEVIDAASANVPGWIVIDLKNAYWLNKINVSFWHDWSFKDVVIQLSMSSDFSSGVTTVFSNDQDDSLGLGIAAVSLDPLISSSAEFLANMGALGTTTNANGNTWNFSTVQARYLRVISAGASGKDQYSVYTEIQAFTGENPNQEIIDEETIVSASEINAAFTVANGSNLAEVLSQLPTTLTIKDVSDTEYQVTGTWTSSTFNADLATGENRAGSYRFVFQTTLPEKLVDAYDLLSTNVIVDAMADISQLIPAITAAEAVAEEQFTTSSYAGLGTAIDHAIAMRDARLKTQAEVDLAIQAISSAQSVLAARGNVAGLLTLLTEIGSISENTYTLSTYTGFATLYATAQQLTALNGNADANQTDVDAVQTALQTAFEKLVVRATEEEISALVASYQAKAEMLSGLDETAYTLSSVSAVRVLLADTVLYADLSQEASKDISHEKAVADQAIIDAIAPVLRGTITSLQNIYNQYLADLGVSETDSGNYLLPGWVRYLDLMEEARLILVIDSADPMKNGNADLTAAYIQNTETALTASVNALLPHGNLVELNAYVASLPAYLESAYVTETYQAFRNAYLAAEKMGLKPENLVSPETVSALRTALESAVAGLVLRGDKTELAALIQQVQSITTAPYTASTYNTFKAALDEARMMIENSDASDAEIDAVQNNLNQASTALVHIGDKTELYAALDAAEGMDSTKYDAELWTEYQAIIAYAESVSNSNNVSQEAVDHATAKLLTATSALAATIVTEKTGCGSTGLISLPSFLTISALGSLLAIVGIVLRRRGL